MPLRRQIHLTVWSKPHLKQTSLFRCQPGHPWPVVRQKGGAHNALLKQTSLFRCQPGHPWPVVRQKGGAHNALLKQTSLFRCQPGHPWPVVRQKGGALQRSSQADIPVSLPARPSMAGRSTKGGRSQRSSQADIPVSLPARPSMAGRSTKGGRSQRSSQADIPVSLPARPSMAGRSTKGGRSQRSSQADIPVSLPARPSMAGRSTKGGRSQRSSQADIPVSLPARPSMAGRSTKGNVHWTFPFVSPPRDGWPDSQFIALFQGISTAAGGYKKTIDQNQMHLGGRYTMLFQHLDGGGTRGHLDPHLVTSGPLWKIGGQRGIEFERELHTVRHLQRSALRPDRPPLFYWDQPATAASSRPVATGSESDRAAPRHVPLYPG